MTLLTPVSVYLLISVYIVLLLTAIIFTFKYTETTSAKILWLLLIFMLPFIGSIVKISFDLINYKLKSKLA